ncbi:hypothetical protein [Streptomyces sp. NPDC012888]|uniref:hypothetical protein n=1 Tax=Streptomyces sp. NPDC012888 TaxID=3364855 RepID=UPI0036989801
MNDFVKFLPAAALPEGGIAEWSPADAERWRRAAVVRWAAPGAGSWALVPLVLTAAVLLGSGGPEPPHSGTGWAGYPQVVLLLSLPLWYRTMPAATVVAGPLLALYSVFRAAGPASADPSVRAGGWLTVAVALLAATGAVLRLRARRRQRALALAAAGPDRRPLPAGLPRGHVRRGLVPLLAGAALCAAAAALLGTGLFHDLRAHGTGRPYDAAGQQLVALALLVPGVPLLGGGAAARRTAGRLRGGPQPALRIGVRSLSPRRNVLYPDARTTGARPVAGYRPRARNRVPEARVLLGGPEERLRREHRDVDATREPFEAVLYGVPCEGAEVVLEYAVHTDSGTSLCSSVTATPLLPLYGSRPRPWSPAERSFRLGVREGRARARQRPPRSRRSVSVSFSFSDDSGGCGGGGD